MSNSPLLEDIQLIRRVDKSNMLQLLLELPGQCEDALSKAKDFQVDFKSEDISSIVFCGMGGSAIGAQLLKCTLEDELKIPVAVVKNYTLPNFINEKTLLFVMSYSGSTEETLSSYGVAKERGAQIITISSGGQLKGLSAKDGFSHLLLPEGLPPRNAIGYMSIVPLTVLSKIGIIEDKGNQVYETVGLLKRMRDEDLSPQIKSPDNEAKRIAQRLHGKFAVIYGASGNMEAAAERFRAELAENSKTLSSSHLFPEMNHNEIVAWENPKGLLKNFLVVLLRDKGEHPQIKERMEISKRLIAREASEVIEVWSEGESTLARIFSLIYKTDFASFYLAILNNVDPTPVDRITYLKEQLKKL